MNKVVLLGTEHPIQRGEKAPDIFRTVLIKECKNNNVESIAEEINKGDSTIASKLAADLTLEYLYADPTLQERRELSIPIDIAHDIINEYRSKYPDIALWPKEPSPDNLPNEVWEEYFGRIENANRMREQFWLEKMKSFNKWPLLFICGTDHFDEFSKLLKTSGYHVIESYKHWLPD